jgi:hypothetical protein
VGILNSEDNVVSNNTETVEDKIPSLTQPQTNFADFIDRVDLLARQGDL